MAKGNEYSGKIGDRILDKVSSLSFSREMLFVSLQYHDHLRVLSANFLCVDFSQDFLGVKKLKILGSNLKGHF